MNVIIKFDIKILMLKYQKGRLHLLRISVVVFGSLYRVFAHSSSLILTSLQSIKCHPTACPCLLLSSIAVLRVVVLSEGEGEG